MRVFVGLGPDSGGQPSFEDVTSSAVAPLPTLAPHVLHRRPGQWTAGPTSSPQPQPPMEPKPAIFLSLGNGEIRFETPGGFGLGPVLGRSSRRRSRPGRAGLTSFALEWEPSLPSLMYIKHGKHWALARGFRSVGLYEVWDRWSASSTPGGELLGVQEIGVGGGLCIRASAGGALRAWKVKRKLMSPSDLSMGRSFDCPGYRPTKTPPLARNGLLMKPQDLTDQGVGRVRPE